MFKSLSLSAAVFFSFVSVAQAGYPVHMVCKPTSPCEHLSGLTYCVPEIKLTSVQNGALLTVMPASFNPSIEIMMVPIEVPVKISGFGDAISFSDETGDFHGSVSQSSYTGRITLDQDFEFQVTCENETAY